MGRAPYPRPFELSKKLRLIRETLSLSQNGMIQLMGLSTKLSQAEISAFERGIRVPPPFILLQYARCAGICADVLIDDNLRLPAKLPSKPRHGSSTGHRDRKEP